MVSGAYFDLLLDENLDLLITSPKPSDKQLAAYYQSEHYISHTDAKKRFQDLLYHQVKRRSLQKKLKLVQSFSLEGKKMLDIGAGTGDFLKTCAEDGWEVIGIEPDEKARVRALEKSPKLKGCLYKSLEALKKEENVFLSFDVITLWHALEHIPNLDETIFDLKKLLKPEGTLVVAVPNFKSYDAAHYREHWAAFDVPRHLWHFSQTAIRRLFFFQQMEIQQTLPMKYDAFYVSLLSEKYKTGRNNFFKAFCLGLLSNWKARRSREYSSLIYVIRNAKKWF